MTKAEEVYADTLNLLGSEPEVRPEVIEILVHLHDAAEASHGKAADQ